MKIHEYQAKELFKGNNIPVPAGSMVFEAEDIKAVAAGIESFPVVVKAQIHAGGRGKGGGVRLVNSPEELFKEATEVLGMTLVTPQTAAEGQKVRKILIEQGQEIEQEIYLSMVTDRQEAGIMIIASMAGGMDIETVSASEPGKITKVGVSPLAGLQAYHIRKVIFGMGLPIDLSKQFSDLLKNVYRLFIEKDCTQIEINPLIVSKSRELIALDAKINFDDNALYRHQDIRELYDNEEEDPLEVEAAGFGLNYIKLDGNVGNMVNGAGLAMATMDTIKKAGAEPANFLDVGGGASAEMVENGFRIILKDKNVKAILVNIFGGILRCDVLAAGIVQAAKNCEISLPVVVRMEGTNVEIGRQILADSGLDLITAADLKDAAAIISKLVGVGA